MRAILCGLVLFVTASTSFAQTTSTEVKKDDPPRIGPTETESVVTKMVTKFGRGLVNIITFIGEWPKQMVLTGRENGFWSAITLGFVKGLGMSVVRLGAGVWEVVFFLSPWPDDYKPILEPEYVWE